MKAHPKMKSPATPRQRVMTPFVLAALSATGPLSIDMYLPSIPDMARSLGSTEGAVQLSLMTFFVGLMLGQLVYGPLSDKFGRKPLIGLGLLIFILGSIGCAMAHDVHQLQWLRFVQGLGGSIGMVISFAIVKDAFSGPELGKMLSLILAVLGLSPVVAPMIGNALQALGSWQAIFWALTLYGALLLAAAAMVLPETRLAEARQAFALGRTLQTYGRIFVDRKFIPFTLALCVAQAGFFAYIAGSASVFISEYNLTATQFSLLFGANALGLVFASVLNPRFHRWIGPLKAYRLKNTAYFIILALLMGYLTTGHNHIAVLSAGLFVTVSLLGFIMPTGSQLALMHQGQYAGTASALMGAMQFGAGAIVTGVSGAMASMGSLGLVAVMLVCALASTLICWIAFPRRLEV